VAHSGDGGTLVVGGTGIRRASSMPISGQTVAAQAATVFVRSIGLCHTDEERTFERPLARLLGYWRLHYCNQLALLSRYWHDAVMHWLDTCNDAPSLLFMLCKSSHRSPRLIPKPASVMESEACYGRSIEIATSMLRWRINSLRRRPTLRLYPTIENHCGVVSLRHDYPPQDRSGLVSLRHDDRPQGRTVATSRHNSVPVFRGGRPSPRRDGGGGAAAAAAAPSVVAAAADRCRRHRRASSME
jgi:hypothetical protein